MSVEHVFHNYGRVRVLKDVNLTFHRGEIHALVGEHGAGKSSLCALLSGLLRPASGQIVIKKNPYHFLTFPSARRNGIELVDQQNFLFENLSVAENLFVSRDSHPSPVYNRNKLFQKAGEYIAQSGFQLDPEIKVKALDLSDRSLVNILKHVYLQPKFLILDETLDNLNTETLHKVVNILTDMKKLNASILFVTHKIDEVYQIADTVTILKEGEVFMSDSVKNIDKINLIKFAYTEMTKVGQIGVTREEFYQILKYNEAILQNLPVNLLVIDTDFKIKLINERAKSFFHLEHRIYYNLPLEDLFLPHNSDAYNLIHGTLQKEQDRTFYNVTLRTNDALKRNNIVINPIYDESFLIGTIVIIEDISEQEELREQMIFSEKLASTGLLAAGVAHEINNPLEIMHNYIEFLKYEISDRKQLEILKILQNQTATISHIVSNLIIFSDDYTDQIETCDLNILLEQAIKLIQPNARHKQIRIHFEKETEVLSLHANTTEIQQVLLNLFKNSFEVMPSGGDVFITTALVQENGVNTARMTFRDTGPGICDDHPMNIFQPFYSPFYSSKTGAESHLGLGLSVSYGIITKYQGTITVENIKGSGCQFVIQLPQTA